MGTIVKIERQLLHVSVQSVGSLTTNSSDADVGSGFSAEMKSSIQALRYAMLRMNEHGDVGKDVLMARDAALPWQRLSWQHVSHSLDVLTRAPSLFLPS